MNDYAKQIKKGKTGKERRKSLAAYAMRRENASVADFREREKKLPPVLKGFFFLSNEKCREG